MYILILICHYIYSNVCFLTFFAYLLNVYLFYIFRIYNINFKHFLS